MARIQRHSETPLDIGEAAKRLGISIEAVRTALDRGLLRGFRDAEGDWRVFLDSAGEHAGPTGAAAAMPRGDTTVTELLLRERIDDLRGRIEQQNAIIADKDRFIAEIAGRVIGLGETAILRDAPEQRQPSPANTTARETAIGIEARYERAMHNMAETLIMVRDYLMQQSRRRDQGRPPAAG